MYTNGNDIVDMASYGDLLWCATTGGVVRWDTSDMSFTKYTTLDGLPTNGINCIETAPDGTVWCGTDYGAARYDGETWETFTEEDGLFDDYVNNVGIASDGVVWCSTKDGGLSRFAGGSWDVLTWPDDLPTRWITDMAVAPNGDVWFGMFGVYRYDGESFELMTDTLGETQVRTIAIAPSGDVWIAMDRHLHYYDGISWTTYLQEDIPSSIVHSDITIGYDNTAWFTQGETVWKHEGGFVEWVKMPMDNASAITVDDSGNVWVGSSLSWYHGRGSVMKVNEDGTSIYQLPDDTGNIIYSASSGPGNSVLLSSPHGVIEYMKEDAGMFYVPGDTEDYPVRADCTAFDTRGNIWFAVNNGLFAYNTVDGGYVSLSSEEFGGGYNIRALVADLSGNIWFTSWSDVMTTYRGYGVVRYDGTECTTYTIGDGLFGDWIQDIAVDKEGNIWVAGKSASEVVLYKSADALKDPVTGGVSCFDGSSWKTWHPEDGIAHYDVLSVAAAPDGTIWAGTREGASRFDGGTWVSYHVEDGLPDERINTVAVDNGNTVWIGTDNGAASFDGATWKRYSTADGLPDRIISIIYVDHDNSVFFCSRHGFSVFDRSVVSVESQRTGPAGMTIRYISPNPFNPSTVICFSLTDPGRVELTIYNSAGQRVRRLVSGCLAAGEHAFAWDGLDDSGRPASSGVYIAGLCAGGKIVSRKMTLVR